MAAAVGLRRDSSDAVAAILRRRYGAVDAILTDSGTSALVMALQRMLPPAGTVAYPAYACIDLTAAAVAAGVQVRLYDLDPATLSPDLDSVRAAIRRGVDAIVVAHLYGYPADVTGVRKIAAEEGIPVIEDAAQGAGGAIGGVPLGSLGEIAILSFGRGKGTTGGGGGGGSRENTGACRLDTSCEIRSERGLARRRGRVEPRGSACVFASIALSSSFLDTWSPAG